MTDPLLDAALGRRKAVLRLSKKGNLTARYGGVLLTVFERPKRSGRWWWSLKGPAGPCGASGMGAGVGERKALRFADRAYASQYGALTAGYEAAGWEGTAADHVGREPRT